MQDVAGATALECLYCGARKKSEPPYAVLYCHCRSAGADHGAPRGALRKTPAR